MISVVVVTYRSRDHVAACLRSVRDHAGGPVQVVVVDNASGDGTPAAARAADPGAAVIESPKNLGFGAANNLALGHCTGDLVLFLNPDAELLAGALPALRAAVESAPDVGAAGPRTQNADGTPQLSFGPVLTLRSEWTQRRLVKGVRERRPAALAEVERRIALRQEPAWLSASCLLVRRAALDAVHGFDEGYFLYEEDVDLGYRLRAKGYRLVHEPAAVVRHHLGASAEGDSGRVRLAYDRAHLRLYSQHNAWPDRAGLRLLLAARAGASLARGNLAEARGLLGLALG